MGVKPSEASTPTPTGGVSGFFQRFWHTLVFWCIGIRMNLKEIFTFHKKFDMKKVPRRPGEVAVITGGGRGIGLQVVKKLLILDMHVVIGCRNESSGTEAIEKLRKGGIATGTSDVLKLDLTSLASVREFANKVTMKYGKIHVLINNGGIMVAPYSKTVDGHESQLQVNYLSHFLLTNLLLPKLIRGGRAGKAGRIVNVSSAAHYGGKIDFDDINMTKMYSKTMGYMASKLMQVVMTKDLNCKLEKEGVHVRVYAVHPGVVKTDLYANVCLVRTFGFILRPIFKSPDQGADGVVFAAISSKFEGEGGHYFANCKKSSVNHLAKRADVQKRLWELSCNLTGWEDVPISEIVKQTMIAARGANLKGQSGSGTSTKEPYPPPQLGRRISIVDHRGKLIEDGEDEVHENYSMSSSTHTVVGNDQIDVVIIPATETSSSEDDTSLVVGGGDESCGESCPNNEGTIVTQITSVEGNNDEVAITEMTDQDLAEISQEGAQL